MPAPIPRFARPFAGLVVLLCYLLQGVASYGPAFAASEPVADRCCGRCVEGHTCCCLDTSGVAACDLRIVTGTVMRPAPCNGMGSSSLVLTAPASVDHLPPSALGLLGPVCQSLRPACGSDLAHSLKLGSPDKIPIA